MNGLQRRLEIFLFLQHLLRIQDDIVNQRAGRQSGALRIRDRTAPERQRCAVVALLHEYLPLIFIPVVPVDADDISYQHGKKSKQTEKQEHQLAAHAPVEGMKPVRRHRRPFFSSVSFPAS